MPTKDPQYGQQRKQRTLIEALLQRSDWDHQDAAAELVETHISWVILHGDYAYKIKKSVNLGFLDFTSLEKRKHYCEEELRLNSRLAQPLYLRVAAIHGQHDAPLFAEDGSPAIEYAVVMRRFPQQQLLDHLLLQGRLSAAIIDGVAGIVAAFHQRIPATPDDSLYGSAEQLWLPVEENFTQLQPCMTEASQRQLLQQLHQWCVNEHRQRHQTFTRRKAEGYIRECHGDMHLGNMLLYDGHPMIFDGIEFNPGFRWIDVMSEIAFCCMDLDDHGQSILAQRLLNRYLSHTGDYAGIAVLRFYLVYRAMVRAKVACIRLQQEMDTGASESTERRQLEGYLALATRYTQASRPMLLITFGFSGSGKSTLSWPLALELAALHIRSDRERQRLFESQQHNGEHGINQGRYSSGATETVYSHLRQIAGTVLAAGYSVIIDATFLKQHFRQDFYHLAQEQQVTFCILDFKAAPEVLRQRILQRAAQGTDISEADLKVLQQQLAQHDPLTEEEQRYSIEIDTEEPSSAERLKAEIEKRKEG